MPQHRCDEQTIDYSRVESGHLRCMVCGREWTLDKMQGWVMSPKEPAPGRRS